VAAADIEALAGLDSAENMVEGAVVGTVLGDSLLAALRRVAHADLTETLRPNLTREGFGSVIDGKRRQVNHLAA
jgi:hypothetical protein